VVVEVVVVGVVVVVVDVVVVVGVVVVVVDVVVVVGVVVVVVDVVLVEVVVIGQHVYTTHISSELGIFVQFPNSQNK
jgi:hypothetical protein